MNRHLSAMYDADDRMTDGLDDLDTRPCRLPRRPAARRPKRYTRTRRTSS